MLKNENAVYKIEIMLTEEEDYPDVPYFWILCCDDGLGWFNDGCGYAATPKEAWEDAYDHYTEHVLNKKDGEQK